MAGTLAAAAAGPLVESVRAEQAPAAERPPFPRKVKLGVVGLGGRGRWIAGLFRRHGGYEMHAVADYFPHVAAEQGAALGVEEARRFSGLSGYKRLIESGVEAIALEDLPYFFPYQARDAVSAGLHVYMAKPVASDVPGVLSVGESGKLATLAKRSFLVDYQMPTDPHNAEVIRRVRAGALGTLQTVFSAGAAGGGSSFEDPPHTANLESRLQSLIWVNDDALGCGYIGNYDIHVVDAVMRAVGRVPVAAHGWGAKFRPSPHGDALDSTCVMFSFADGTVWNHQSPKGKSEQWFSSNGSLAAEIQGADAAARVSYWGKAYVRGGPEHYGGGDVANLYEAGAVRNIAAFYEQLTGGDTANQTLQPAVDSALVCILGREAAARRATVTMTDVLRENRRLEVDLRGLTD
jgi:predicted dehydrogenase